MMVSGRVEGKIPTQLPPPKPDRRDAGRFPVRPLAQPHPAGSHTGESGSVTIKDDGGAPVDFKDIALRPGVGVVDFGYPSLGRGFFNLRIVPFHREIDAGDRLLQPMLRDSKVLRADRCRLELAHPWPHHVGIEPTIGATAQQQYQKDNGQSEKPSCIGWRFAFRHSLLPVNHSGRPGIGAEEQGKDLPVGMIDRCDITLFCGGMGAGIAPGHQPEDDVA